MRQLASLVLSFLLLLSSVSSVSATSFSYTTSAFATFTFSGIEADVFQPVADHRNTVSGSGGSIGFENFPINIPRSGAADSSVSSSGAVPISSSLFVSENFSSASLFDGGRLASALSTQGIRITGKEVGWLTTTINYQFTEVGVVPMGSSFVATSTVRAFHDFFGEFPGTFRQVETISPRGESLTINRTIAGSFSGSAFFDTIGSGRGFGFHVESVIVPEPDAFWLLLGGLATLVVWMERRKLFAL